MTEFITAQTNHLPHLAAIVKECIVQMELQGIHQWDDVYPAEGDFAQDVNEKTLYTIYSSGNIAGCICINEEVCPGYENAQWISATFVVVHRLLIAPSFQGRGIGKEAMLFAEQVALARGKESIRLDAFTGNPAALRLYQHLGYRSRGMVNFRKGRFYLFEKILVRGA